MRSLQHMSQALDGKLWWRFRERSSLWAEFLWEKYVKTSHPLLISPQPSDSHVWKSMIAIRDFMEERIGWEINKGEISLLWDQWLPSRVIGYELGDREDLRVSQFIQDGSWNSSLVHSYFSSDIAQNIMAHPICANHEEEDKLIWKPSPCGKFSLASLYEELRIKQPSSRINSMIWGDRVPSKISFFMSNLLRHRLPLDAVLLRFGVMGPSMCSCCSTHSEEDFDHLFSLSELAAPVWGYFEGPLGIRDNDSGWRQRCLRMWMMDNLSKPQKFCVKLIPSLICWNVWKARNANRYQGTRYSVYSIIFQIMFDLSIFVHQEGYKYFLRNVTWLEMIDSLGSWKRRSKVIQVWWEKPPPGVFKLNTDGSAFGYPGPAFGGGVLRDEFGNLVFAFSYFFGVTSSFEAEAAALLLGLQLCNIFGISNIIVECDSKTLVDIFNDNGRIPWKLAIVFKKIARHKGLVTRAQHCFRQANMVADRLAAEAQASRASIFFRDQSALPSIVKNCLYFDRIGICNLRFT